MESEAPTEASVTEETENSTQKSESCIPTTPPLSTFQEDGDKMSAISPPPRSDFHSSSVGHFIEVFDFSFYFQGSNDESDGSLSGNHLGNNEKEVVIKEKSLDDEETITHMDEDLVLMASILSFVMFYCRTFHLLICVILLKIKVFLVVKYVLKTYLQSFPH